MRTIAQATGEYKEIIDGCHRFNLIICNSGCGVFNEKEDPIEWGKGSRQLNLTLALRVYVRAAGSALIPARKASSGLAHVIFSCRLEKKEK